MRAPPCLPAILLLGLLQGGGRADTEFWREDFENGCQQLCPGDGYSGPNGAWTVSDVGPPGASANTWYVSCAENGNQEGSCGSGCGDNETLHVGNVAGSPAAFLFCPTGDCGAAYDATDGSVVSDKRIASPVIDASGRTSLRVSFLYMAEGQPCSDAVDLEYSPDGGVNWATLDACLRTDNTGCGGQGRWASYGIALPADADDNPDLRLAFRWYNNGDLMGSDPSFAVDAISVTSDADCLSGLSRIERLNAVKLTGEAAELSWAADPGAPGYHLNSVAAKPALLDPRRPPGNGTPECDVDAPATSCTDPDALSPAQPLLFYQALSACGPDGADEGPF